MARAKLLVSPVSFVLLALAVGYAIAVATDGKKEAKTSKLLPRRHPSSDRVPPAPRKLMFSPPPAAVDAKVPYFPYASCPVQGSCEDLPLVLRVVNVTEGDFATPPLRLYSSILFQISHRQTALTASSGAGNASTAGSVAHASSLLHAASSSGSGSGVAVSSGGNSTHTHTAGPCNSLLSGVQELRVRLNASALKEHPIKFVTTVNGVNVRNEILNANDEKDGAATLLSIPLTSLTPAQIAAGSDFILIATAAPSRELTTNNRANAVNGQRPTALPSHPSLPDYIVTSKEYLMDYNSTERNAVVQAYTAGIQYSLLGQQRGCCPACWTRLSYSQPKEEDEHCGDSCGVAARGGVYDTCLNRLEYYTCSGAYLLCGFPWSAPLMARFAAANPHSCSPCTTDALGWCNPVADRTWTYCCAEHP